MSSASSPRHFARTCTSTLHVSFDLTLVWMPMPSQIYCRHGSPGSLHVPVLSRDVSSPSLRQFQLSGRTILRRQNSSSLTVVFLTMQKSRASPLRHSTACALARQVLSCPVAVCVHVHELRECVDLHQTLCTRATFQVSCDALHVHLVALSGTEDLSCCLLHAVHDVSTMLPHVQQLSHGCLVTRLVSRSPGGPVTLSLVFPSHLKSRFFQTKHGNHVLDVLRIRLNRVSTSRFHDHSAKKDNSLAQSLHLDFI